MQLDYWQFYAGIFLDIIARSSHIQHVNLEIEVLVEKKHLNI